MRKLRNWIQQLSIKQKWSIVSALTIIVSYALISGMLYIAVYNWLLNEEQRTATRTMADVQSFFAEQGATITVQDIKANTTLINAILEQEQTIRIFNFDGYEIIRINNSTPTLKEKPAVQDILQSSMVRAKMDGNDYLVVYAPIQIGFFQGYFELIHPLTTFQAMMKYIVTLFVMLGLGAVVIAALLGRAIATVLLKPILDLRNSMKTIKEQGIKQTSSPTYGADDEIGQLFSMYESMLIELKESFNRQQQFVQDASHELRTPIQAIEGHLSLIQRWGKNDPDVLEESVATSLAEVRRMKRLMEELLLLAKNEEQKSINEVDIEQVIKDVVEELQYVYPNSRLNVKSSGMKRYAYMTEEGLGQIIRNIVENAMRHSQSTAPVEILLEYKDDLTVITIKDYGVGIPEKHIPYIFNRFYRVDESRNAEKGGTGLGLSITKMLADKYNIAIEVNSRVNEGTIFMLTIPSKSHVKST